MLSRVADSVYWMSRYSERAENVARFVDVNYNLTLGSTNPITEQWSPLVYTTGDQDLFFENYDSATRENVLQFLLFDEDNPNSILSCVSSARESARTVREVLPVSVWEQVNRFYLLVRDASKTRAAIDHPYDFCESVRTASHLMVGVTHSSMLRDQAWSFLQIGRFLERADKTSRIVDVQYYLLLPNPKDIGTTIDFVRWSSLLKSADAYTMYRRTWGRISPEHVAQFLILNSEFPRSIRYCLAQVTRHLALLDHATQRAEGSVSSRLALDISQQLDDLTIEEMIADGMHNVIDRLQHSINEIGGLVYNEFCNVAAQHERLSALQTEVESLVTGSSGQLQSQS